MKPCADNKSNITKMTISLCDTVNTVEKGANARYKHFLLYQFFFPKPSCLGSLKDGTVWKRVTQRQNKTDIRIKFHYSAHGNSVLLRIHTLLLQVFSI